MNESRGGLGASPENAATLMLPAITRLSLSDVCALILIPHRSCFLNRSESNASLYLFNFFHFSRYVAVWVWSSLCSNLCSSFVSLFVSATFESSICSCLCLSVRAEIYSDLKNAEKWSSCLHDHLVILVSLPATHSWERHFDG